MEIDDDNPIEGWSQEEEEKEVSEMKFADGWTDGRTDTTSLLCALSMHLILSLILDSACKQLHTVSDK